MASIERSYVLSEALTAQVRQYLIDHRRGGKVTQSDVLFAPARSCGLFLAVVSQDRAHLYEGVASFTGMVEEDAESAWKTTKEKKDG